MNSKPEKYEQRSNAAEESYASLPFGDFIKLLKNEGFVVDVKDFAEFTRVFENFSSPVFGKSSTDTEDPRLQLKYYLAPLICRNETEQAKFYQFFDHFYNKEKKEDGKTDGIVKPKKWWQRKIMLLPILLVTALALIGISNWFNGSSETGTYNATINFDILKGSLWKNSPIQFSFVDSPVNNAGKGTIATWNFGDGTDPVLSKRPIHTFKNCGDFPVSVSIKDSVTGKLLDTPSLRMSITSPVLLNSDNASYNINDVVVVTAKNADSNSVGTYNIWAIQNTSTNHIDTVNASSVLRYLIKDAGTYNIFLFEKNGCPPVPLSFTVAGRNNFALSLVPVGSPIQKELHLSPFWIGGLILLSLLGFIAAYFLYRRAKTEKNITASPDNQFSGVATPIEIPFLPRDGKIVKLQKQTAASNLLLQRTESEAVYLDIPKTLKNTINNFGFVAPEYTNRQKDRDYLVLIDTSIATGSQYYHLFAYLVKTYARDNVNLSFYFFDKTPDKLYTENGRSYQNLSRIKDKHYGSNLLVFGNGYAFINGIFPKVDNKVKEGLGFWNKRILITPIPTRDWSGNEEILSSFFNLVPADIEALLTLVKFINEDVPGKSSFKKEDWKTYRSKYLNLEEIAPLKEYINDKDVFQWLCAIAVFHKIRWEVIIEIGRNILARSNAAGKLNYTNLLKIARIKWIEEGSFPSSLRLALLKELTVENELIARKTMLTMMSESNQLIDPNSFSYEEKMVQQYTDSFVLYANNNQQNASYKNNAEKFIELWKQNNIMDMPLRIYLENDKHTWETPLNALADKKTNTIERKNINANEFVNSITKKKRPISSYVSAAASVLAVALLLGSQLLIDDFYKSKINSYLHIVNQKYPTESDITVRVLTNKCSLLYDSSASAHRLSLIFDSTQSNFGISRLDTTRLRDSLNKDRFDSLIYSTQINLDTLSDKNPYVVLSNGSGSIRTGLLTDSFYTQYDLSVTGTACNTKYQPLRVEVSYDSSDILAQVDQFQRLIAADSFEISGTPQASKNVSSTVFYYNRNLKDRASQLAALASQFFKRPVTTTDGIAGDSVGKNFLELWISKISCVQIQPSAMSYIVHGMWYFNDNMKYGILFEGNRITIRNANNYKGTGPSSSNFSQSFSIRQIEQCRDRYTIVCEKLSTEGKGIPTIFTLQLTQTNKQNLQITRSDLMSSGRYQLLFDQTAFTTPAKIDSRDYGDWNTSESLSGNNISIAQNTITISRPASQNNAQQKTSGPAVYNIRSTYKDGLNNIIYSAYDATGLASSVEFITVQKGGNKYLNFWRVPGGKGLDVRNFKMSQSDFALPIFARLPDLSDIKVNGYGATKNPSTSKEPVKKRVKRPTTKSKSY